MNMFSGRTETFCCLHHAHVLGIVDIRYLWDLAERLNNVWFIHLFLPKCERSCKILPGVLLIRAPINPTHVNHILKRSKHCAFWCLKLGFCKLKILLKRRLPWSLEERVGFSDVLYLLQLSASLPCLSFAFWQTLLGYSTAPRGCQPLSTAAYQLWLALYKPGILFFFTFFFSHHLANLNAYRKRLWGVLFFCCHPAGEMGWITQWCLSVVLES